MIFDKLFILVSTDGDFVASCLTVKCENDRCPLSNFCRFRLNAYMTVIYKKTAQTQLFVLLTYLIKVKSALLKNVTTLNSRYRIRHKTYRENFIENF